MKEFKAEIVWRDIESITPYVNNSKEHKTAQVDKIAGSIAEFGFDQAIVVDGDGVIIKGHGRREAALRLGIKQVPVTVRTDLTPTQVRAARIADNRVAESEWITDILKLELQELSIDDFKLDILGFEIGELKDLMSPNEGDPWGDDENKSDDGAAQDGQVNRILLIYKPEEYARIIQLSEMAMASLGAEDMSDLFRKLLEDSVGDSDGKN